MHIQILKQGSRLVAVLALLGFLFCASPVFATSINLLTNGSFEDSSLIPNSTFTDGLFTGTTNGDITGWTTVGTVGALGYWYFNNGSRFGTAEDGQRFIELENTASLGPVSQSFAVTKNTTYEVSFWSGIRADGATGQDTITAAVALAVGSASGTLSSTASGLTPIGAGATPAGWQQFNYSFTPDSDTTATLTFSNSGGYGCIDNVSITAVPEPASLAILSAGLLSLLAYAWRRQK